MARSESSSEEPSRTILGLPTPQPRVTETLRRSRTLVGVELCGRYLIESVIGRGGMATVYLGRHITIGKQVAIKVLHDEYANQADPVARFLQEARTSSRIIHENVVEISDYGTTSDMVFFVMELLQGENLYQTIRGTNGLPWPRVAGLMLQLCAGLGAAHAVGVVHRDLKPENCFRITRGGNEDSLKVIDFGIAKFIEPDDGDGEARRTRTGLIAGTPEYMAPEQARGTQCDHRVDVYAAGAMLFELSTGRAPYVADSAADILALHLTAPVPDPLAVDPTLPSALRDIVAKAMAKRREDRYASMDELAAAIREVTLDEAPAPTFLHTHRRWIAAAAAVLVVGVAGVIVAPTDDELATRPLVTAIAPASAVTPDAPPTVTPASPPRDAVPQLVAPPQVGQAAPAVAAPPTPDGVAAAAPRSTKSSRPRKPSTTAPAAGPPSAAAADDPDRPRTEFSRPTRPAPPSPSTGKTPSPSSEVKNPFADD